MALKRRRKICVKHVHKENDQITARDLFYHLWEGRNLEISSLWQRSALLIALLTLSFAGYGGLWISFLESNEKLINSLGYNLGFLIVSMCGILFSVLWIMMAKGSKYWVEKYEMSINQIVGPYSKYSVLDPSIVVDDQSRKSESDSRWTENNKREGIYKYPDYLPRHGSLVNTTRGKKKTDYRFFSTEGAPYSPSGVNIFIGTLALMLWFCASIIHLGVFVLKGFRISGLIFRPRHAFLIGRHYLSFPWIGFVLFIFFAAFVGFFVLLLVKAIVKCRSNEHIEEKKKAICKKIEGFKTTNNKDYDHYNKLIQNSLSGDEESFSQLKEELDSIDDYGVIENITTILDENIQLKKR